MKAKFDYEIKDGILVVKNGKEIDDYFYIHLRILSIEPIYIDMIVLNEGLETIGAYAFKGCRMKKIIIPSTVNFLGKSAFDNCFLERVYLYEDSPISKLSKSELYEIFGHNVRIIILPKSAIVRSTNITKVTDLTINSSEISFLYEGNNTVLNINLIIDSYISKQKIERLKNFLF